MDERWHLAGKMFARLVKGPEAAPAAQTSDDALADAEYAALSRAWDAAGEDARRRFRNLIDA